MNKQSGCHNPFEQPNGAHLPVCQETAPGNLMPCPDPGVRTPGTLCRSRVSGTMTGMPIQIHSTTLPDVLLIEPVVFADNRGFFLETYHRGKYAEAGLDVLFVQDNHSRSRKNTLRGLHYQAAHPQGKLIWAAAGEIFDVAVDIRKGSPAFGKWLGIHLTEANHLQLYIPPGFAHGFCVLSETADLMYKCTDFYFPEDDCGLLWNDPDIGINWPVTDPVLSKKDASLPRLSEVPPSRLL